jgi:urease accessory protein
MGRVMTAPDHSTLIRLLQLSSPTLPTGAFSYSQGLEWAVAAGWVHDRQSLGEWLGETMRGTVCRVDIPLLACMHQACAAADLGELDRLCDLLLACRECHELREEERQRGRAMAVLLAGLGLLSGDRWRAVLSRSQLAGFAYAAQRWGIGQGEAALGYLWSWLENQVLAGVKIIPLGQTAGQILLLELGAKIGPAVTRGLVLAEDDIGSSSPALALAGCFHESQYTRLYRS